MGGALSSLDVLVGLYFGGFLNLDPKLPQDPKRDRVLLSAGHVCPALYAILAKKGFFSPARLKKLRHLNSGLEGHPVLGSLPGVENTSGSLGHGLSLGLGMALGLEMKRFSSRVFVLMGDGDHQEGSTWEAIMAASHFGVGNLKVIVDRNRMQIGGRTENQMKLGPLVSRYQSFGWQVLQIDGHNYEQILSGLDWLVQFKTLPSVLICQTIRGKGIKSLESSDRSHKVDIENKQEYQKFLDELT